MSWEIYRNSQIENHIPFFPPYWILQALTIATVISPPTTQGVIMKIWAMTVKCTEHVNSPLGYVYTVVDPYRCIPDLAADRRSVYTQNASIVAFSERPKYPIETMAMCTRASFLERFQKRFHLFYRFDALFTRTKGKYFQSIELAPTSAVNC